MAQGTPRTPNEKLKAARDERSWTQKEVAEKIGVPETSTISDWERGKNVPGLHYRAKLRNLFDMSDEELGFTKPEKKFHTAHNREPVELTDLSSFPTQSSNQQTNHEQDATSKEQNHGGIGTTCSDETEEAFLQPPSDMFVAFKEKGSDGKNGSDANASNLIPPAEQTSANQGDPIVSKQQKLPFQITLSRTWPVLLKVVCVVILCALAIFYVSKTLFPPPPQSIHSQPCSDHPVDYVVVYTMSGNYCFSGTGTMDFHANNVTRIDTDNYIASWRYIDSTGENREPSNVDWKLHVCNNMTVSYPSPIQLTKLFMASPAATIKCTNKASSS